MLESVLTLPVNGVGKINLRGSEFGLVEQATPASESAVGPYRL
jgi:hypothetical protein